MSIPIFQRSKLRHIPLVPDIQTSECLLINSQSQKGFTLICGIPEKGKEGL